MSDAELPARPVTLAQPPACGVAAVSPPPAVQPLQNNSCVILCICPSAIGTVCAFPFHNEQPAGPFPEARPTYPHSHPPDPSTGPAAYPRLLASSFSPATPARIMPAEPNEPGSDTDGHDASRPDVPGVRKRPLPVPLPEADRGRPQEGRAAAVGDQGPLQGVEGARAWRVAEAPGSDEVGRGWSEACWRVGGARTFACALGLSYYSVKPREASSGVSDSKGNPFWQGEAASAARPGGWPAASKPAVFPQPLPQ